MMYMICLILAIIILYLLSTLCRRGHSGLQALRGWAYAHRGLHGDGVPENSMAAFRAAKMAGYGIELDIHLMADGNLAVIHDAALKRTTGKEGYIEQVTADQLADLYLEGTQETVPQLCDVLALINGEVPLILELKAEGNNCPQLCQTVCDALKDYCGVYCLESFDPRCIMWLKKNRPDLIRGQLSENYFSAHKSKMPWYLKLVLTNHMMNFLSLPDFVAYRYRDRKRFANSICRKLWGAQGVTWTIKSQQDFDTAVSEGWIPIFEGFLP